MLFETQRLIIRTFETGDLEDFHQYRSDPKVCHYQGYEPMDEAACQKYIADQQDKILGNFEGWMQIAIVKKSDGKVIGDFGLKLMEHELSVAELGISLSANEQKKGFAQEAMEGLLYYLFNSKKILRIQALVLTQNRPAIRILEKIGFSQEAHFCEITFFNREWCDEFMYALLKKEWIAS